jgi:YgiT-type zinc finger domain-containing protein
MLRSETILPYEIGDDQVIVVKSVPALVCRQCGEAFIEIETVRTLEQIVDGAEKSGMISGFLRYRDAA